MQRPPTAALAATIIIILPPDLPGKVDMIH